MANANTDLNIVPNRVVDIVVEEEEEEEGDRSSFRNDRVFSALAASSVLLKYKIIVKDPLLTVEILRAGLMEATRSGKMDRDLHFFATQFGATVLINATLAVPQVTNSAVPRASSSQLTGVMITLLVIGVIMALLVLAVTVMWLWRPQTPTLSSDVTPLATVQGNGTADLTY